MSTPNTPKERSGFYFKHARVQLATPGQGRTHQEMSAATDINRIMSHWRKTSQITHLNPSKPWYGDFSNATDYLTATLKTRQANQAFMDLPSSVRDACDNDPGVFLQMIDSPDTLAELQSAGLNVGTPEAPASPPPTTPEPAAGESSTPAAPGGETP